MKETIDINFYTDLDKMDIKFVMSDNFLETLTQSVCKINNKTLEEIQINEDTIEDKITKIYKLLCYIKQQQNEYNLIIKNKYKYNISEHRYNILRLKIIGFIFGFLINYIILMNKNNKLQKLIIYN